MSSDKKQKPTETKARRCLDELLTPVSKTAHRLEKRFDVFCAAEAMNRSAKQEIGLEQNSPSFRKNHWSANQQFDSPIQRSTLIGQFTEATEGVANSRGTKRTHESEGTKQEQMMSTNFGSNAGEDFEYPKSADGQRLRGWDETRIKNFRNDKDIDDFDDCFSIKERLNEIEEDSFFCWFDNVLRSEEACSVLCSVSGVPMVSAAKVRKLLEEDSRRVVMIDVRYFYEASSGRVKNSHNVMFPDDLQRGFIIAKKSGRADELVYVFYDDGEEAKSSNRAIRLWRHIRNLDRSDNMLELDFENMFVLKGGFKTFMEENEKFCEGVFVSVDDWRFANDNTAKELQKQVAKRWILAKAARSLDDFPTRV
jgi:hypothetical protein